MSRIYVRSLSDYNNGHLHGDWIDLEGLDEIEVQDAINVILRGSRYPNVTYTCHTCDGDSAVRAAVELARKGTHTPHCDCNGTGVIPSAEEWAIHDYEDMTDMGENPSIAELVETARLLEEHGDAWRAYVEHVGSHYATESGFEDAQAGSADSELAWVENFLEETGVLGEMPENLRNYFDTEAYLRDMKLGGDVGFEEVDGTVYAFWNH